ncbi:MAG: class I SAM-dependent methyltransferase [Anaerolineales bacterium]|jgi:ubiquinone/menaquinone biosynthesis C-methylase UbiE
MTLSAQSGTLSRIINRILIIFFQLLYNQFAWTYDWVADMVSIGRWKSWVLTVEPLIRETKTLEIGCGPGHLQLDASMNNSEIFGLDTSRKMLQQARRRLMRNNCEGNLVLGKAQKLPYRAGSFKKIVMTFPSEFVYDPQTAEQIWRVLGEDGELILLPAAWITGVNKLDRLAAWLFRITNQAPNLDHNSIEEKLIRSFQGLEEVGFNLQSSLIELQGSEILLIHGTKETISD